MIGPATGAVPEQTASSGAIHDLRERLLQARHQHDPSVIEELIEDVQVLARRGYRCCLVDFDKCRPAFYVRVVGFENTRVTAELEFPIEPGLRTVQHVPLSHLVEYDEADPHLIRGIYGRLAPFLHQGRAQLAPAPTPRSQDQRQQRKAARGGAGRRSSMAGWWAVAGLLFVSSLVVFVVV